MSLLLCFRSITFFFFFWLGNYPFNWPPYQKMALSLYNAAKLVCQFKKRTSVLPKSVCGVSLTERHLNVQPCSQFKRIGSGRLVFISCVPVRCCLLNGVEIFMTTCGHQGALACTFHSFPHKNGTCL